MFARLYRKDLGTVDLAILTDSNKYIEYTVEFRQKHLTMYVAKRIRSMFDSYLIDKYTDIVVNKLDETHPLYLYFMLLKQHIGFQLMEVDKNKITDRLHYYYTRNYKKRHSFMSTWKATIEKGVCPWITQEIEYKIQNKGPTIADRIRMLRLGLFYIVVKNFLCKKPKNHTDKKSMNI